MNGKKEVLNPFGKELAWEVYQNNIIRINEIRTMFASSDINTPDEHTMLYSALEMIGRMTDNTIFLPSIERIMKREQ